MVVHNSTRKPPGHCAR